MNSLVIFCVFAVATFSLSAQIDKGPEYGHKPDRLANQIARVMGVLLLAVGAWLLWMEVMKPW